MTINTLGVFLIGIIYHFVATIYGLGLFLFGEFSNCVELEMFKRITGLIYSIWFLGIIIFMCIYIYKRKMKSKISVINERFIDAWLYLLNLNIINSILWIFNHKSSLHSSSSSSSPAPPWPIPFWIIGSQTPSTSFLFSSYSSLSASGFSSKNDCPSLKASSIVYSSSDASLPFNFSGSFKLDLTE